MLPTLTGAFDLVFIDADKESNTVYLDWAAKLGHPGTVVVLDNIGRDGEIVRDDSTDSKVNGTRAGLRMLGRTRASTPRRCRRSGSRGGTASRSPSSCDSGASRRFISGSRPMPGIDWARIDDAPHTLPS